LFKLHHDNRRYSLIEALGDAGRTYLERLRDAEIEHRFTGQATCNPSKGSQARTAGATEQRRKVPRPRKERAR